MIVGPPHPQLTTSLEVGRVLESMREGRGLEERPDPRPAICSTPDWLLYGVTYNVAAPADLGGAVHQALVVAVPAVHGIATVAVLGV